jgi:efflux ABC superfamily ATP binding cassette transporter, permease protein
MGSPNGTDALATALKEEQETGIVFRDVSTGVVLTLLFGFALTSMSIFLGQVSSAFEDKELIRSLDLMGVPRRFQFRTNTLAVMGPIVALSIFGFLFGAGIAGTMFLSIVWDEGVDLAERLLISFSFLAVGWAVTFLAIALVEPLRGHVLRSGRRKE